MKFLDHDPDADLLCFYCGKAAETWDHIFGLVKLHEYAGLGHTLGKLVPCCKDCNSKKGNRDWSDFLDRSIHDVDQRQKKRSVLQAYIDRYGHSRFTQADIGALCVEEMERYRQIQTHILMLMKEADDLASNIRAKVRDRLEHTVAPIAATADVPKLARSM
ncbi:MAG: endonuclease [Chloroflexi bacterium]|nr:endonuclease [Chloroflexota bacterium]